MVVGAGPTGVELAGQIALLANKVLKDDYRHIDPSTARVLLLDATPHVLGTYPPKLGRHASTTSPVRRESTRRGPMLFLTSKRTSSAHIIY